MAATGKFFTGLRGCVVRVMGVAGLSIRAAVRTKTAAALGVLLAASVFGLPCLIRGDGTAEGALQILLSYTVGFSFGLLALATLWAACSLFAAERDSGRIQLTVVKPVRPLELWLGKWFALLVLNGALLLLVYGGVYAQICYRFPRETGARPGCSFVTHPNLPTPAEEAREMYARMEREGAIPTNLTRRAVLRVLEEKALERYSVLNPGTEERWNFTLDQPLSVGETLDVRIRFDTEFSTRTYVQGVCLLSTPDLPGKAVEVPLRDFTQNEIAFTVNTELFALEKSPPDSGKFLRRFDLVFRNSSQSKGVTALMLRFRQDVVLLTPGGTFEQNLLRAAFLHAAVLAALSAFGLFLSACLSLPVAAFVATVSVALCMVGNSVVQVVAEEDELEWKNKPGILVSRFVHSMTEAALQGAPLRSVARGERIETDLLLRAIGADFMVIPFFFAVLSSVILRRREWADPET